MRTVLTSPRKLATLAVLVLFVSLASIASEASELKINLKTTMAGTSFNGELPKGKSEYEVESTSRRLFFEVGNINLPGGSLVDIYVNGTKIGSVTVRNHGATLLKSTFAAQSVPSVSIGSTVKVKFGATTLLSGKF